MELSLGTLAGAQTAIASDPSLDPHLFLTLQDFEARKTIAQREPWAKAALAALLKEADGYPQDDLNRFGLTKVAAPEKKKSLLKSAIFPEAGYAMLRAKNNDLSVILKFGPHGGGHGHYDKLGEIVYAEGRTQAVDPGTQLYGMALHKEWDQMSVAHNTTTADESRQDQATGKLVAWKDGDGYVAVNMTRDGWYELERTGMR